MNLGTETEKDHNSESQTVECKESWRDEYLKWLCDFANAQSGVYRHSLISQVFGC
ncbi:MAG: hypothetical protein WCR31_12620 [Treponema sp.]